MRQYAAIVVTLSALASAAPVLADQSSLAAVAGLTPEQAQGMTLNEIAAVKFNRGRSPQERIPVGTPGAVTSMAFQDSIDVSSHYQLIRAAGLTPEQAEGMTLNEIVHMISPD